MSIVLLFAKTPSLAEPTYFWGGSYYLQREFDVWSKKKRKKTNIVRWLQRLSKSNALSRWEAIQRNVPRPLSSLFHSDVWKTTTLWPF